MRYKIYSNVEMLLSKLAKHEKNRLFSLEYFESIIHKFLYDGEGFLVLAHSPNYRTNFFSSLFPHAD